MRKLLMASAAMSLAIAPVAAQVESELDRQVTVRLDNILQEMAADLDLPDALLPETIDVPADVAAQACGVAPSDFAARGGAACAAVSSSPELTRFIQQEMVVSGRPVDEAATVEDPTRSALDDDNQELGSPLDETGESRIQDEDDPAATATSASPSVNGDDPMDAAPSDIREPADQLPDFGPDGRPTAGAQPPIDPAPSRGTQVPPPSAGAN